MMRLKAIVASCLVSLTLVALVACSSESYTPETATPSLSSPDIIEDGVLHVGVNSSAAPLAGNNSAGDLVGFDVDLAAALADQLGLKLELSDVGSDGETALSEGTVDIVLGLEQGSSSSGIWESDVYLDTGVALFSLDADAEVPTTEDDSLSIAVQTSSTSSWMVENQFGSDAVVRTASLSEAFAALISGEASYVAADAVRGSYVISNENEGSGISIIALMQQPSGYCIGALETNTSLCEALSDALSTFINGGMVDVLDKKWLGVDWDLSAVPLTAGASTSDTTEEESDTTNESESDEESSSETESNAVTPEDVAAA